MKKAILAVTLSFVMAVSGCSVPAWVGQVGTIVAALAPAAVNILQIIALAEGKPYNAALGAKVAADAATIKVLAVDFSAASAAAAPQACAQLQAALGTFGTDQQQIFSLIQVSSSATQVKVNLLYNLLNGAFQTVAALIPACNAPVALRESLAKSNVLIDGNQFVSSYNSALVIPTGNKSVDSYTRSHKIHAHSLVVRILSMGHEK